MISMTICGITDVPKSQLKNKQIFQGLTLVGVKPNKIFK